MKRGDKENDKKNIDEPRLEWTRGEGMEIRWKRRLKIGE